MLRAILGRLSVLIIILCFAAISNGCYESKESEAFIVQGYVPIYGDVEESSIEMLPPRTVNNPGKIYVYGGYLLVNEINAGIHLFDNTNPTQPQSLGFIRMLGNSDMAIKDGVMYADYLGSLVALQVNDFETITVSGKLELSEWNIGVPPPPESYFECVDSEKGFVVSWTKAELKNPGCYAY